MRSFKTRIFAFPNFGYDDNMTTVKQQPVRSIAYRETRESLEVHDKNQFAHLNDPAKLPRPLRAYLESDGTLSYVYPHGKLPESYVLQTPHAGLCFDFAQLAHGSDEQIRDFAEHWGPLGSKPPSQEHLKHWRRYAVLADALLQF